MPVSVSDPDPERVPEPRSGSRKDVYTLLSLARMRMRALERGVTPDTLDGEEERTSPSVSVSVSGSVLSGRGIVSDGEADGAGSSAEEVGPKVDEEGEQALRVKF